jgi:HK97 family phage prohead protease
MPYGISDKQTDCGGWAVVKVDDGMLETVACHETKQDAIDQMVAISISEDLEPLGEMDEMEDDSLRAVDTGEQENPEAGYNSGDMTETLAAVHWVSDSQDEKRSIAYTNLELREAGDGHTFVGYAAVFDSPSEPMPFIEYVRKGAFAKTLNDGADVRFLIDHEGVPLARTKSGTLSLTEDERGLRVEASLDPMNPDAQRVISAMRRGDLSQMSFAFRTIKDSWNGDYSVRELKEVQLYDVSVVTYPAYEDTVAELRRVQHATVAASSPVLLRQRQLQIARHR